MENHSGAKKPVAVRYWYGAWRSERATRRTERDSVTVVTTRAGRLAVGRVPPGGSTTAAE